MSVSVCLGVCTSVPFVVWRMFAQHEQKSQLDQKEKRLLFSFMYIANVMWLAGEKACLILIFSTHQL